MNQIFVDRMRSGTESLGITLSERQIEQFYQYYELLLEWNQVMNLTAITELPDVTDKHFIDSLALVKVCDPASLDGKSLIDVGTGAGFPGIPLKIAFPRLKVNLLDSLNKRVKFLNAVSEKLLLDEVTAVHGRAEDLGHGDSYRECFDICVSRAVANIATLAEYCIPFVKTGGIFVAYKSGTIDEELEKGKNAVRLLGGTIEDVIYFHLAGADAERSLVVIRKTEPTKKRFPRKAGVPGKEPLM